MQTSKLALRDVSKWFFSSAWRRKLRYEKHSLERARTIEALEYSPKHVSTQQQRQY
jgi:hypothetical protein